MNESAQSGILFGLSVLLAILIVKFPTWYRESKVKPGDVWVYCPENDDPFKSVKCDTTYVLQTHGNYALWREYRYSHLSRERYTYELSSRKNMSQDGAHSGLRKEGNESLTNTNPNV